VLQQIIARHAKNSRLEGIFIENVKKCNFKIPFDLMCFYSQKNLQNIIRKKHNFLKTFSSRKSEINLLCDIPKLKNAHALHQASVFICFY